MYGKVRLNKLLIGSIFYSVTGSEMYIHNLEIKRELRGKGYFKYLFQAAKTTALTNGCQTIRLEPAHQRIPGKCPSTKRLRELYSRYGFVTEDGVYYNYDLKNQKQRHNT